MITQRTKAYCRRCRHAQRFERVTVNHGLHVIIAILTGGLWIVSWMAITLGQYFRPWRCSHCGWHDPEFGVASHSAPGESTWLDAHAHARDARTRAKRNNVRSALLAVAVSLVEML